MLLYAVVTSAGLAASVWAPPVMLEVIGAQWSRVWGLFLLFGGLVCLIGVLMPRGTRGDWFGEFVAIPLVASAVAVYAGVALKTVDLVPGRLAGALLLLGLAVLISVRWFRVRDDAKKSTTSTPPTRASA